MFLRRRGEDSVNKTTVIIIPYDFHIKVFILDERQMVIVTIDIEVLQKAQGIHKVV